MGTGLDWVGLYDALAASAADDARVIDAAQAAAVEASTPLCAHPGPQSAIRGDLVTAMPCPDCGTDGWVVDGHEGDRWLLCVDVVGRDCLRTKPIPRHVRILDLHAVA